MTGVQTCALPIWRARTDREELEHRVRAAAVAARDEADFVRRLGEAGVRARPRFVPQFVTSEIDSFPSEHVLRIRALLQENRPVHSMETVMYRPDGSACHVLYSGSLITLSGQQWHYNH